MSKILNSENELFGLELIFVDFKNYYNLIESHITKVNKEYQAKYNNQANYKEAKKFGKFSNEYLLFLYEQYINELNNLTVQYPHNLRASFLIHIISFIEYELREICDYHHGKNNTDFRLTDLKGSSDMEKAKKYLSKAAKIDFSKLNPEWDAINTIRKIRNKIVHHNGTIKVTDADWNELEMFCKHTQLINLIEEAGSNNSQEKSNFNIIIPNRELNYKLIADTESFFIKLMNEINHTYR
jgi:hypothetical protein